MNPESQPSKRRDVATSSLDATIKVMTCAKVALKGTPGGEAALASVIVILTAIKVCPLAAYLDQPRIYIHRIR